MNAEELPIEHELIKSGVLCDELQIVNTTITPTVGNEDWAVRIELQIDEDLVPSCSLGLIFVLAVLSFHDGRPRGNSGRWFEDDDQFSAADLLRHLKFDQGCQRLYVDYLRRRCINRHSGDERCMGVS